MVAPRNLGMSLPLRVHPHFVQCQRLVGGIEANRDVGDILHAALVDGALRQMLILHLPLYAGPRLPVDQQVVDAATQFVLGCGRLEIRRYALDPIRRRPDPVLRGRENRRGGMDQRRGDQRARQETTPVASPLPQYLLHG